MQELLLGRRQQPQPPLSGSFCRCIEILCGGGRCEFFRAKGLYRIRLGRQVTNTKKAAASQWQELGKKLRADGSPYVEVHRTAYKLDKFAQLYPFVGIAGFGFSKVCEYLFFVDVLVAHIDDDRFVVRVGSCGGSLANTNPVREGDAATCVEIANQILPNSVGRNKDTHHSIETNRRVQVSSASSCGSGPTRW